MPDNLTEDKITMITTKEEFLSSVGPAKDLMNHLDFLGNINLNILSTSFEQHKVDVLRLNQLAYRFDQTDLVIAVDWDELREFESSDKSKWNKKRSETSQKMAESAGKLSKLIENRWSYFKLITMPSSESSSRIDIVEKHLKKREGEGVI